MKIISKFILLIVFLFNVNEVAFATSYFTEKQLHDLVNAFNEKFPMNASKYTRFDSVSKMGRTLNFKILMINTESSFYKRDSFGVIKEVLKEQIRNDYCGDSGMFHALKEGDVSISANYYYKGGSLLYVYLNPYSCSEPVVSDDYNQFYGRR